MSHGTVRLHKIKWVRYIKCVQISVVTGLVLGGGGGGGGGEGGLSHIPPKFENIFVAVITFPLLSSVLILLRLAYCLLYVL